MYSLLPPAPAAVSWGAASAGAGGPGAAHLFVGAWPAAGSSACRVAGYSRAPSPQRCAAYIGLLVPAWFCLASRKPHLPPISVSLLPLCARSLLPLRGRPPERLSEQEHEGPSDEPCGAEQYQNYRQIEGRDENRGENATDPGANVAQTERSSAHLGGNRMNEM